MADALYLLTLKLPENIILFELDFYIKFPLLPVLQFLSDLKSIILKYKNAFSFIHFKSVRKFSNKEI